MNITFALDDALVAAAKSLAARQNTSVNALVRSALEHQVALGGGDSGAGTASGVLQELLEYSAGSR
ncbi:MAG: ribbon-helix-helix protein, CopG family, partial [Rhodocyclaceae bacterium]|nr:ribbon-helix-helix protein, CopG family [Rhodocyclaceae bacterium]